MGHGLHFGGGLDCLGGWIVGFGGTLRNHVAAGVVLVTGVLAWAAVVFVAASSALVFEAATEGEATWAAVVSCELVSIHQTLRGPE